MGILPEMTPVPMLFGLSVMLISLVLTVGYLIALWRHDHQHLVHHNSRRKQT